MVKGQNCIPIQGRLNLSGAKHGQELSEDKYCHAAGSPQAKELRDLQVANHLQIPLDIRSWNEV